MDREAYIDGIDETSLSYGWLFPLDLSKLILRFTFSEELEWGEDDDWKVFPLKHIEIFNSCDDFEELFKRVTIYIKSHSTDRNCLRIHIKFGNNNKELDFCPVTKVFTCSICVSGNTKRGLIRLH